MTRPARRRWAAPRRRSRPPGGGGHRLGDVLAADVGHLDQLGALRHEDGDGGAPLDGLAGGGLGADDLPGRHRVAEGLALGAHQLERLDRPAAAAGAVPGGMAGTSRGWGPSATTTAIGASVSADGAGAVGERMTMPTGTSSENSCWGSPGVRPAAVMASWASSTGLPTRSVGTVRSSRPSDTVSTTVSPSFSDSPAGGSWLRISPGSLVVGPALLALLDVPAVLLDQLLGVVAARRRRSRAPRGSAPAGSGTRRSRRRRGGRPRRSG